jgi:hypothetical protein
VVRSVLQRMTDYLGRRVSDGRESLKFETFLEAKMSCLCFLRLNATVIG